MPIAALYGVPANDGEAFNCGRVVSGRWRTQARCDFQQSRNLIVSCIAGRSTAHEWYRIKAFNQQKYDQLRSPERVADYFIQTALT